MTDTMTAAQRHYCMSRIKGKNTKPELAVRRWLWTHGYRYRLNVSSVPGKPDIVMRPYRTAIFVNGCFWHGHHIDLPATDSGLPLANSACCKIPSTNRSFWTEKIRRNQQRDQRNYRILQENGWHVIVVWECQLSPKNIEQTMRDVELLLSGNFLSHHRKPAPQSYRLDEEPPLPLAAEGDDR